MRIYALRGPTTCLLAALLPLAAAAEVQVKVLADGTKLIYSETQTQRSRRTAGRLVSAPTWEIGQLIEIHAQRQGLSTRLVQSVMQVESGYNAKARSSKGAMGLMQLMPGTARELGVTRPYDPEQNVRGGTTYLRQQLRRFSGNLSLALAAYNAGPSAVEKYGGVPPYRETRNYVRKVLALYRGTPLSASSAQAQSRPLQKEAETGAARRRGGDPVYLRRDASGRIVVSTSPKPN